MASGKWQKIVGLRLIVKRKFWNSKLGFTLIELSIVLVIIGLLAGGVLAGKDLIKASEIRAQVSQIEKLNAAVHTFQTKYNGLPGDLKYTEAGAFGLYVITHAPYIGTRGEGDGNGYIESHNWPSNLLAGEPFMFFRHLSDAKLIDGNYGANLDTAAEYANGGAVNEYLPKGKIANTSIEANYADDGYNYFVLTNIATFEAWGFNGQSLNALAAQEAYNIDQKIDNGLPATGNVIAINAAGHRVLDQDSTWTTVSAVSGCVASSAYAVTQTTQSCSLRFKFQ